MAKFKNINQISFVFNEDIKMEYDVSVSLKNLPQGYKKQFFLKLINEKFPDSQNLQKDIRNFMGLRIEVQNIENNISDKIKTEPEIMSQKVEERKHAVIKNATY